MGFYINQTGNYYEGDKADWRDKEVPQRPDHTYIWKDDEWVVDDVLLKQLNDEESKKKLIDNDLASIRAIREYIVGSSETKVKATEYLSICEDYAIQERTKMGLSIDASVVEKS